MSSGHKQEHDEHETDSHSHGGGNSHEVHGDWHDDFEAWDNDHDDGQDRHEKEHKVDHWGNEIHEDHDEESDENEEPIEPAGIVNDLCFDLDPMVDLTAFFEFSEVMTIQHSLLPVFGDLCPATSNQNINISRPLVLKISAPEIRPPMSDLYPEKRYEPKIFGVGEIKFKPRFNTISLYQPLPKTQENTVDIRTLSIIESKRLYPDVYLMPPTFQRSIRKIRQRHGAKMLKISLGMVSIGFVLSMSLITLTYYAKNDIVAGYGELTQLSFQAEPSQVKEQIRSIHDHFTNASRLFIPMNFLITSGIIQNETLWNGYHALYAGLAVSNILWTVDELQSDFSTSVSDTVSSEYLNPEMFLNSRLPLTDYYKNHTSSFARVEESLSQAQFHFSSITTTGNPSQDTQLSKINAVLKNIESLFQYVSVHREKILAILGNKKPMNYLILNQNRDELRANGWFPGSAIEITLYKGKLEKYVKKDIYYYDWHLFPYGEIPPPGINQIAKTWGMRDANYFPDIRESFQTISRMYEKAGGSTLDGMVAINQWLIEDILSVTGPIRVLWLPDSIDSKSFSVLMSVLVEGEYGRKNTAKDILFLTIDAIQKKISEVKEYDQYFNVIRKNIDNWQILVALRDDSLNAFSEDIFGKPKYRDNQKNFVYPVFTSLSGNKSDRYMKRTFYLSHLSSSGCVSTNRIEIVSEHTFSIPQREQIRTMLYQYGVDPKEHEHELFVQWNGDNVQYIRMLIPKNSTFVGISKDLESTFQMSVQNTEYDEIAFTVTTEVGKTSHAYVDYSSTPADCHSDFDFIVQPGLQNFQIQTK